MKLKFAAVVATALMLTGCGSADKDAMKQGLVKTGMEQTQADCYAVALADVIEADIYNNIAESLVQGSTERDAVNKARRKFGAEFKAPLNKARTGCVN